MCQQGKAEEQSVVLTVFDPKYPTLSVFDHSKHARLNRGFDGGQDGEEGSRGLVLYLCGLQLLTGHRTRARAYGKGGSAEGTTWDVSACPGVAEVQTMAQSLHQPAMMMADATIQYYCPSLTKSTPPTHHSAEAKTKGRRGESRRLAAVWQRRSKST